MLPGVSPLDGPAACPAQRKIQPGERLPYHKRDWSPADLRGSGPNGYQQSDSFPVRTALGTAVVQTYDFGDAGSRRAYGRFDAGDGGQVAFFSPGSAAFGITEDGGAGLQLFIGPACTVLDSWVIVDASFNERPSGETLARITRDPTRCLGRLGYAYTRWHVQPVRYSAKSGGRPLSAELRTLVSDHFGGRSAAGRGPPGTVLLHPRTGLHQMGTLAEHRRPRPPRGPPPSRGIRPDRALRAAAGPAPGRRPLAAAGLPAMDDRSAPKRARGRPAGVLDQSVAG